MGIYRSIYRSIWEIGFILSGICKWELCCRYVRSGYQTSPTNQRRAPCGCVPPSGRANTDPVDSSSPFPAKPPSPVSPPRRPLARPPEPGCWEGNRRVVIESLWRPLSARWGQRGGSEHYPACTAPLGFARLGRRSGLERTGPVSNTVVTCGLQPGPGPGAEPAVRSCRLHQTRRLGAQTRRLGD